MAFKEKDETPMAMISPRSKEAFFEDCLQKHKELGKNQCEYKKALCTRLIQRSERIKEISYKNGIERLKMERNDLRAQIWVANASCYANADRKYLEQIECHITCQEHLSKQIGNLKELIGNLQREISSVDKEIYKLSRKTVPENRHQEYVAQLRKQFSILENKLEVNIRHECAFTDLNATLKEEIKTLVENCKRFSTTYNKYVQVLYDNKKYLTDLQEYASHTFQSAIEMSERVLNAQQRKVKESEQAKLWVQGIMRFSAAVEWANDFMCCKNVTRVLADLPLLETRRRANFKQEKLKKIRTYNNVLSQIFEYTQSFHIDIFVRKYQQQELLYHSYFNWTNRTGYHLTSLENAISLLNTNIEKVKYENLQKLTDGKEKIAILSEKLDVQQKRNANLKTAVSNNKKLLDSFYKELTLIFNMCRANATPVASLLGDHSHINIENLAAFMNILEQRISHIVRFVYIKERQLENIGPNEFTVKDIAKYWEPATEIDSIVLTQQCPECAEGGMFHTDNDGQNVVKILSKEDVKKKLFEDIAQPDMQYRLHSISQCRLPKSRLLAANRQT